MTIPLLNSEEQQALRGFVDQSPPGTAFLRRAQIMLLADQGMPAESIASELEVPVVRVRQLLRAFNRERMALFPGRIMAPRPAFSAGDPLPEAARQIMAGLLNLARSYEDDLVKEANAVSVHETRKAIRQLRTACRLFAPAFEDGLLDAYRRRFRKFMRRLAVSRDTTVLLQKLDEHLQESEEEAELSSEQREKLEALQRYWQAQRAMADQEIRRYLSKGKYQALLAEFELFCQSPEMGMPPSTDPLENPLVGHLAPVFIYDKVAAVRAFEGYLQDAPAARLHVLRIRCKELRYTLEFFQPVMGASVIEVIDIVRQLLAQLGELNDARIHVKMLAQMDERELAPVVAWFRQMREADLAALTAGLFDLWPAFEQPAWRQNLAAAIAVL